jgi:hypothetical protein
VGGGGYLMAGGMGGGVTWFATQGRRTRTRAAGGQGWHWALLLRELKTVMADGW